MRFELAFIVPVETTANGQVRKLVFEAESGQRASVLAGPWGKKTQINKGLLDGAAIVAPYALPVVLRQTQHGPVLRTNGVRLFAEGVATAAVKDGKAIVGTDGKPVMNLTVASFEVTTYAMSAGDDEDCLSSGIADPFDGGVIA